MSIIHSSKYITLMRHGESDRSFIGRDFDRPLTQLGIDTSCTQSQQIKALPTINYVLCSGAARTRTTFECIKDAIASDTKIEYDDKLFLAPTSYLIKRLENIDDQYNHVLVIGHGPTLTGCYNWLTDAASTYSLMFEPSEVKHLQCNIDKWNELYPGCVN